MAEFVKVTKITDVPHGKAVAVEVAGKKIAIFNVGGIFHAIDGACTHEAASLSDGHVEGTIVTCPLHAAMFDLTSGEHLSPPATRGVNTYDVKIEGDDVLINVG